MQVRGRRTSTFLLLLSVTVLACGLIARAADLAQPRKTLRVAGVQFRSSRNLVDNANRMTMQIHDAGTNGARVVVFPECALSGYFEDVITNLSSVQLFGAEKQIAQACREAK